jgi:hypothetical protein
MIPLSGQTCPTFSHDAPHNAWHSAGFNNIGNFLFRMTAQDHILLCFLIRFAVTLNIMLGFL